MKQYFSGELLYGNDFTEAEIEKWYALEAEGYANIDAADTEHYRYIYHNINRFGAYNHVDLPEQASVLSIGGAYGHELLPVIDKIGSITILEPSQQLRQQELEGIAIDYETPVPSGVMNFPDNSFDLITCFGTLHHIPNVSFVVSEVARVLKPGGVFVTREPIVSMGDWRKPRFGLTANERGIPLRLMRRFITDAGLRIEREQPCMVRPLAIAYQKLLGRSAMDSKLFLTVDSLLARVLRPFSVYHARNTVQKIRPAWCYYLATKPLQTSRKTR